MLPWKRKFTRFLCNNRSHWWLISWTKLTKIGKKVKTNKQTKVNFSFGILFLVQQQSTHCPILPISTLAVLSSCQKRNCQTARVLSKQIQSPRFGETPATKMILKSHRLFIGNIPAGTSEQELRQEFSAYGNVEAIEIKTKTNPLNDSVDTFGFVTLQTEDHIVPQCK